jgi:hypothetical protein
MRAQTKTKTKLNWLNEIRRFSSYRYVCPKEGLFEYYGPYFEKVEVISKKYLKRILSLGRYKKTPEAIKKYFTTSSPMLKVIANPYYLTSSKRGVFSIEEIMNVCEYQIRVPDIPEDVFFHRADESRRATIQNNMKIYSQEILKKEPKLKQIEEWMELHEKATD